MDDEAETHPAPSEEKVITKMVKWLSHVATEVGYDFREETRSLRLKLDALELKWFDKKEDRNINLWIKKLEKSVA